MNPEFIKSKKGFDKYQYKGFFIGIRRSNYFYVHVAVSLNDQDLFAFTKASNGDALETCKKIIDLICGGEHE